MAKRVIVLAEAEAELVAAADWYERQRPGLGVEFRHQVDAAWSRLNEPPLATLPLPGVRTANIRRVFVERFPYAVVFVERGDDALVLAFAHHHRRSGYWRGRHRREADLALPFGRLGWRSFSPLDLVQPGT